MFENKKKKYLIFNSFTYLHGQTIHHECIQWSFFLSNSDHFGPKTYINFHLEVDENFFWTPLTTLSPNLKKSEKFQYL